VYLDEEGARVLEGPDWSLALITQDHSWVWGPPEGVRPSITLATLAQLIPEVSQHSCGQCRRGQWYEQVCGTWRGRGLAEWGAGG
jgi:hypothetical protein